MLAPTGSPVTPEEGSAGPVVDRLVLHLAIEGAVDVDLLATATRRGYVGRHGDMCPLAFGRWRRAYGIDGPRSIEIVANETGAIIEYRLPTVISGNDAFPARGHYVALVWIDPESQRHGLDVVRGEVSDLDGGGAVGVARELRAVVAERGGDPRQVVLEVVPAGG